MKKKRLILTAVIAFTVTISLAFFSSAVFALATPETFDVNITINNVQNLFGLEVAVSYNTACVDLVEAAPAPPWERYLILKNQINDAEGTYRLSMVGVAPAQPFDGSTVLAKLTFLRTDIGESDIHLSETYLADFSVEPIPHTTIGCDIYAIPVHDIAVTQILACPRSAIQGGLININVTVKNQGNFAESFDVTVYADADKSVIGDEIVVGEQAVTDLPAKTSKILHFVWDTTGVPYGCYWLSAEATVVPFETDIDDNFLKAAEYIGGIYPPQAVRERTDLAVRATAVLLFASLVFSGAVGIKRNWFP